MSILFQESGKVNTAQALHIAFAEAEKLSSPTILIATTTGETLQAALPFVKASNARVVFITHNTGFTEPGAQQLPEEIRNLAILAGATVHTSTMALRNVGAAIKTNFGWSETEIINAALRMFGQGAKVGLEIAAMACDAGLIPPMDVITVAGTASGADTVMLVAAQPSNTFFNMRVRDILAKPR